MGTSIKAIVSGLVIVGLGLNVSACNTTKATFDSTVKFFSSTSPEEMFTVDGLVNPRQKINLYTGVMYENLQQDGANGGGEYLTSLSVLLDVQPVYRDEFAAFVQNKYPLLFTADLSTDRTAHLKMLTNLSREWAAADKSFRIALPQ